MSDIRFNNWYHQSGTGGVTQASNGFVGIGSTIPTAQLDIAGNINVNGNEVLDSTTSFGGDVSGTYNSISVTNDSHTHAFNNLTGKTSGTGEYSTSGYLVSGRGSGGVSLTYNDGYGNANVTFNHHSGIPEQDGKAGRIEVNTDSTTGDATMSFELGDASSGVAAGITQILELSSGTSTWLSAAGLTFSNRPAFNGGTSGSTSPFTVDSTTKVTNLNADLLDDLSSGSFLRSDADDTYTGTITGATLLLGGSEITASSAALQVNGFQRTGTIYLHEGTSAGATNAALSNSSNVLSWNSNKIWHEGNDGSGSGLDADTLDGYQADTSGTNSTVAVRSGNGDLNCRLVRQTFGNQSTISGGLVYRINDGSDNYLRICNDKPAIRSYLGFSAVDTSANTLTFAGTVSAAKFWERSASPDYQTSGVSMDAGKIRATGLNGSGAVIGNTNTSGYNTMISFVGGSTSAGYGAIEANSSNGPRFVAPSDRRMKTNIRPAESQFELFKQLQFYNYTMDYPELIEDPINDCLGMIADEVQQVMPELVTGEPNAVDGDGNPEYQSVAYTGLVPHSIAAIKELILKVEELQARLDAAGL